MRHVWCERNENNKPYGNMRILATTTIRTKIILNVLRRSLVCVLKYYETSSFLVIIFSIVYSSTDRPYLIRSSLKQFDWFEVARTIIRKKNEFWCIAQNMLLLSQWLNPMDFNISTRSLVYSSYSTCILNPDWENNSQNRYCSSKVSSEIVQAWVVIDRTVCQGKI